MAAISECAKGLEGNRLHKEAGDKTNALVPRVSDVESGVTLSCDIPRNNIPLIHISPCLCLLYTGVRRRY